MLPVEAADKGLKLAGAAQLKVLIAVYRNMSAPSDLKKIASDAGLSVGDAEDALRYWIGRGLILSLDDAGAAAPAEAGDAKDRRENADGKTPTAPAEKAPGAEEKKRIFLFSSAVRGGRGNPRAVSARAAGPRQDSRV